MDLAASTLWWLATGAAVLAELITGTFYLLMVALGLAAAAIAAHLGAPQWLQFLVAAIVGSASVLALYARHKRRGETGPRVTANSDVNPDIGSTVNVESWNADGTATVRYRGANWTAIARSGDARSTGMHRIAEVVGSRLVVDKI